MYWLCYLGVKWVLRCFVNFIFFNLSYLIYRVIYKYVGNVGILDKIYYLK